MILLFVRFPLMISMFQGVWGRTEKTFACVYVLFLRPCFLTFRFNFSRKSPLAVSACTRPQSFVISEAPFHTFAGEKRSIILADCLCSCLECLCETEQWEIHAHKNTSSAKSRNDRFKDGPLQAKLTETLFKRQSNGLISREQRSWCWFIAGANKNLLISNKSEHCWDKRGRHNGVWLITLQTLGAARSHTRARARTSYNPESLLSTLQGSQSFNGADPSQMNAHIYKLAPSCLLPPRLFWNCCFTTWDGFYWIYCHYYFLRNIFFLFYNFNYI